MLTFGPSFFHKHSNSSFLIRKVFKQFFLFASVLPLGRISAILDHTGGVSAQKPPKYTHFVDVESVRTTLEIFNLTTTNDVLIKLTTIIYLHGSVNRKALSIRNSFFWLNLIASLVKLLYKLENMLGSIP